MKYNTLKSFSQQFTMFAALSMFLLAGCGQADNKNTTPKDTEQSKTEKTNDHKSEFDGLKGLKIERIDHNTVLVTDGFYYQRDFTLGSPIVVRIKDLQGDIIIPEADSLVPAGHITSIGVTLVFTKVGMVWRDEQFTYTSLATNASMEFTKQGVLLKSFKIEKSL
jgi:hypothetical protein